MKSFVSPFRRFIQRLLIVLSFFGIAEMGWGQVWTYDFGNGTGSHTSSTASTSFLPTPTSGTSRVRVGTGPGSIALVNPGIALGTGSELQITSNTGSTSTTKFSVYDYTASKSGYMKFTIAFNGGTNGVYQFTIGDGATFSDNAAMATTQIFTGIQWTFGASNSITYRVLNNATYGTTGITNSSTLFSQSTSSSYIVEAYFNNETTSKNYSRSGSSYSIASGTWDLWIGGTLIGNDIARGGMSNNVNIDSWAFNHQSSSTSPGTIYIDDIEYSNILVTSAVVTNTSPPTNISATTATLGGNVTATGGVSILENGSVYSLTATNAAPQIGGTGVTQLATSSPGAGTGAFTNNISATLAVNTQYSFNAYATNSVGTSYGTVSTFYTLANVPSAPTVNNETTTSLDVAINANANPSTTEFAIQETGGNYVQANGTLGATAVWQTAAAWGTKIVTGLTANTTYTFQVKARNGATIPVETAFSNTAALSTLAGESPVANITGPVAEQNLNGGTLQVSLTNETFTGTPTSGDFTLNNAPSNLTIGSVTYNSATSVTLNLVYSGDFDSNITTFSVTIASSVLTSAAALTTNDITLTALVESLSVGTVTGFGNQTVNTTSLEKSFTVSGTVRSAVSIVPPSGYEISLGTTGTFVAANPISLSPTGTSLASTTIYVRFKPVGISAYNGNITVSATSATSATVALTGSGISPSNPSVFTATTLSNSQINLAATANSNSNNIVVVYNATGSFSSPTDGAAAGSQGSAFAGGTIWYNGPAASLTNHTGLSAATLYYYKAFSYDALNFYSLGSTANATTVKEEPSAQATSLLFSSITINSFNTAFTTAAGAPDGYLVIRSTSSSLSSNPIDGTTYAAGTSFGGGVVVSSGSASTGIASSVLSSGTIYHLFVFAYNNSGSTIDYLTSNPLSGNTITLCVAPAPSASNVVALSFDVSWTAVTGAASYSLDVATDAGFTSFVFGFNNLTVSETSQTISGLLSNTTYYFRVRSVNASGNSAYGSGSQLTTILAAPVATGAASILTNGFTSNWNAVTGASSGYLLDVSTTATFGTITNATDLFISEYVEGSSSNKYIEIYNGTGASIDLSNYKLQLFNNGATTATGSNDVTLSGTLANGATIVFKNSAATIYSGTASTNAAVNFNGNDAIALYKISTSSYVDIIGRIGTNPGAEWTSGSLSTLDKTLVRKSSVTGGVTTNPPTDFTTLATEWNVYNQNDVSNLGSHTFTSFVPSFVTGYNAKVISGQSTTSSEVIGLNEATTYYYRVRATDGSASANSNIITVTTKKTPTVTPIIGTYTYTGSAQGPNSIVNQTPTPTSVTYSYTGTGATTYGPSTTQPTNAGSYTVTATVEEDANYISGSSSATAFTIGVATPVVTVTVGTYTYSGSGQGPDSATNTGTGTSYTFSYSGTGVTTYGPSPTKPTIAGSYTVVTTIAANGNYSSATSSATAFTITPASLTVAIADQTKCEGSTLNLTATNFTVGGIIEPDAVTSISYTSASNVVVGSYSIVPSVVGTGLTNYTVSNSGTLTVTPHSWIGGSIGDWNTAANWCGGIPTIATNVVIPSSTVVTISAGAVANTITIAGTLSVASTGNLTVATNIVNSGTLDILSGGQLLQGSDTDISGGGQCIYRKDLPLQPNSALSGFNRSYYIGSPVVGSTSTTPVNIISVLGSSTTGLNMYGYTETNNSWPLYYSGTLQGQGSTFDIGKGYFVNSSSGTYFSQANFTGNSFNNGDVTVSLTNTAGQGGGYNLISNPYPSGINWSDIYNDASNTSLVGSSYWLRTYDTGGAGMVYKTCNASGVSTQGLNTIISPATGFWVKYTGTSPGTFTFKNAMRTNGAGTYYTMNANRIIRLDLGNGTYDDQAVVYLNEDAGLGIESYDSDKRIPSTTVHQLYSLEGTTKLAINGFNNAIAKDTVLLGMQIPTAGTYTINASQIDATIEEDVFLEDKITGAYQNLKTTPSYSFTSTQGTFNNRFVLHFAPFVPALPGQTAATAIAMPTSNWPQCNNVTSEDQWHAFTATSEGISIAVNTATTDIVIELQDGTGNVVAQENAVNGIGNETLNFFGLTAGQIYKVGVRNNISSQPTGTYGICVKSLKRGGCDYGAGPYSLCQYYKATWAGSTGVSYTFTFTGTSGPATGQTFTRTQSSDICVLSTVTPLLPYGSTYSVVISNTYTLTDGAGNTEQITVPSTSACQVITIAEPQTTLNANSSCNNGPRFRGSVVSSAPWVCGASNWRWRFTEVNPLTMQTIGLPIELNRGAASNFLSLGTVNQLQSGKTYAVRTAPVFNYTGTNYNWGPTRYMCIVGAAQGMLQDAAQEAAQGSNRLLTQDSSQENDVLVYTTTGQQIKVWTNIENSALNNATVRIYNSTGSLVYTQRMSSNEIIIDLDAAAGLYIVEVCEVKRKVVISPLAP